jgi:hypothetical protein
VTPATFEKDATSEKKESTFKKEPSVSSGARKSVPGRTCQSPFCHPSCRSSAFNEAKLNNLK